MTTGRSGAPGPEGRFDGLVVAHAAVNGGMITNFGRIVAKRLVQGGAELHFFVSKYPVFGWPPPVQDLESLGGEYHGLPLPQGLAPLRELWSLLLMASQLRRSGVDVLHTRSSVMGFVGRVAGRLAGVPVLVHHQDDLVCRDQRLSPRSRRAVAFIERTLSNLSQRSLFISRAVYDDALAIGFRRERCVLVGIDLSERFQEAATRPLPPPTGLRAHLRALGVPEGAKVAGCIGRLAHLKGIDLLIGAAAAVLPSFPGWVVVIKGDGPLRESYRQAIRSAGLEDRIFLMTEELPPGELPSLYGCFDLFVLPTRREGFGMVFAEAMAMGLPVIAPRMAPVTEVVPEECGRCFEPEDVEDLADALSELMGDARARASLAEKGKAHALSTWCGRETAAERVLQLYRDLLAERGVRPRRGNGPGRAGDGSP